MTHELEVKQSYDDTPFSAWFDHYFDSQMHLGYWPDGKDERTLAEATRALTRILIGKLNARPTHRILDVGCGVYAGPAIQLAAETGCYVDGITLEDSAKWIVPRRATAHGVGENVRVQVGRAQELPFDDGTFDGAWAIEMLIHIPDKAPVFQEIYRVLRPGAKLVIADYPAEAAFDPEDPWITGNHFTPSTRSEIEQMLADTGFTDITCEDYNDSVAIPTFQKMLESLQSHPDRMKSIVGEEFYEGGLEILPKGIEAHRERALSYAIFSACTA